MTTLITLGCSLSPSNENHVCCWAGSLAEHLQPEHHIHNAFGGGGNQQLLDYLSRYVLEHSLKDHIIVYQITGINRGGGVFTKESLESANITLNQKHKRKPHTNMGYWDTFDSYFGDEQYTIWANTKYDIVKQQLKLENSEMKLTRLVSTLSLLSLAGAKVFTFRGWSGALAGHTWTNDVDDKAEDRWKKCKQVFNRTGVEYIDECLVDWCMENNLKFVDDWHPNFESHDMFADKFIVPRFT